MTKFLSRLQLHAKFGKIGRGQFVGSLLGNKPVITHAGSYICMIAICY